MKRSSKKMIAVVTTLAALAGQTAPAVACGGGGFRGGFSFGGSRVFSQPAVSHSRPVSYASRPNVSYSYAQPTYTQPAYTQPSYQQPSSVVMQSQYGSVPQQVLSAPTQQQSIPTQSTMQNQVPQTGMAQAGSNQGQMVQGQSMNNATPQSNQLQGNNTQANNQATNKQVAENNTVPTPSPTSGSAASNTSEQSALQMLASLAVPTENQASSASMPQFSPADNGSPATDRAPAYIGTWTATLPNEASIQLQLNQDGQFNWTATQNGKASTFAGEFTVVDGRLILVRAGDRQELKGGWAVSGQNAFNFKLDGAQDGGLNFQRG